MSRGRAVVARQAHNLKVAGSIPAPATKKHRKNLQVLGDFLFILTHERNRVSMFHRLVTAMSHLLANYVGHRRNLYILHTIPPDCLMSNYYILYR